jgi:hypothetical protein
VREHGTDLSLLEDKDFMAYELPMDWSRSVTTQRRATTTPQTRGGMAGIRAEAVQGAVT